MDQYEIIITPDATSDLYELRDYIADVLLAPNTALKYIRTIREAIETLKQLPERNPAVSEEPWHSYGIRKIIVKNFYVYYRVDKKDLRVYILNVIYNRRDQLRQLARINMEQ